VRRNVGRRCTVAQVNLWRLLRDGLLSSLLGHKLVGIHLNLLRYVKGLDALVVMDLWLESSLSLMSLIYLGIADNALTVSNAIVQDCLWTDIPVVEFVLDVGYLVFSRIRKAPHHGAMSRARQVQLLTDVKPIFQHWRSICFLAFIGH